MTLLKTIILLLIFYIPVALAQDTEDPFREFEVDEPIKVEKEKAKTTIVKKEPKKSSNIKDPKTYLAAKNYILKGVVTSSNKSFAIIGTKETLDQVITLGEALGKEGWKVLNIKEESILVGNPSNKKQSTTLYIVD